MTEHEYEKMNKRVQEYKKENGNLFTLTYDRDRIAGGVEAIRFSQNTLVDFIGFDDDFRERLANTIMRFIDAEIENVKKRMDNI